MNDNDHISEMKQELIAATDITKTGDTKAAITGKIPTQITLIGKGIITIGITNGKKQETTINLTPIVITLRKMIKVKGINPTLKINRKLVALTPYRELLVHISR